MALIQCPECGHDISDKAEKCPNCGYKIEKKKVKMPILDSLCLLSLVLATFINILGGFMLSWVICFVWLIVFQIIYDRKKKDETVDVSVINKTRITVFIFFLCQIPVTVIF